MVDETQISGQVSAMVDINDGLISSLADYKLSVLTGRWLIPGGAIVYAADDTSRADYEVENWRTGALKWMGDGAQGVRDGTVTWEAWATWGISLSDEAAGIAGRLNDAGLWTRTRQFAAGMPKSLGIVVGSVVDAAGQVIAPALGAAGNLLKPLVPWIAGGIALIILLKFMPTSRKA